MAQENYNGQYGNGNMDTNNSLNSLTPHQKNPDASQGAPMTELEADRFERFAAALASNNKLRDASRVNSLRVADVGALGLYAFGFTTALLQGVNTKWTGRTMDNAENTSQITYCYALLYGGLVQLLAGMWAVYRNNTFAGVAFSSYGGFWLGYGIYGILASSGVFTAPVGEGIQMALALWCVFTACLWAQTPNINIALFCLFGGLTITFALLSAGVNHPRVNKAGGYFGIFTAGCAFYTATAELTNEVYRRTILPLGILNVATAIARPNDQARPDTV